MSRPALSVDLHVSTAPEQWRRLPPLSEKERSSVLVINRFTKSTADTQELTATCPSDFYTLGTNLRRTKMIAFVNSRQVFGGDAQPGYIHIARPEDRLRFVYSEAADEYHMFLPVPVIQEALDESELSKTPTTSELLQRSDFKQDRKIFNLFHALAAAPKESKPLNQLYVQGLSLAVVSALLSGYSDHAGAVAKIRRHGLTGWQLKLVQEFVDANLAQAISLNDLAGVLGLSRMHFAAQFLQSTGLRPHEYLLKERVRRAEQLLLDSKLSILEIALSIGFETQSHFSTVFRRFVGDSPARWRANRSR